MTLDARLALYLSVAREATTGFISSTTIAETTGINSTQIRRDLADYGIGKRGMGMSRDALIAALEPEVRAVATRITLDARRNALNYNRVLAEVTGLRGD